MRHATKKIVCRVRVDQSARSVDFTWSEGSSSFKPYTLEREQVADFHANVRAARERLFCLVKQHEQPLDRRDPASYRLACCDLARAGHDLYNQIFDESARDGEQVGAIADWLRDVTQSSQVESLELVCEGQPWFAPWNLVYDAEPDDAEFDGGSAGFAAFWGMRYNICGGQPVDPLRRMPLPAKPRVLVVIDPFVREALRDYPDADGTTQRDRLDHFLDGLGLVPVECRSALEKALRERRPHIIYWLGHADPDALHLGPEKLDQTALRNLLRNMKKREAAGGLVFLNGCRTAESGDLGSFLKTFHDYEFSGLIATEEQTLDSFANPFGLGVLERFFTPGTSIGSVLRNLRKSRGPLGLLYGAYCPPDLHVRAEEEPAAEPAPFAPDPTHSGGQVLGTSEFPAIDAARRCRPLPDAPYRPLDAYGPCDRALFHGREADILRCALILGRPETRLMVLHGESGVGKSSFLRAGLIPYLEEDCVGYRFLRSRDAGDDMSTVLFIRATDDPAGQIARALLEFAGWPWHYRTPAGHPFEVDLPGELAAALGLAEVPTASALAERLLADPALLDGVLTRLGRVVPVTPVLVIDQAEEVFTLARGTREQRVRDRVLELLRHVAGGSGDYKLIVSLRTEFYGRLVSALRLGLSEPDGVRDYLLTDLDSSAMAAVIRRPTSREPLPGGAEIPFEKYGGFEYDDGVPETIARAVAAHGRTDGVTLLLQVVCAQLFERAMARDDHRVSEGDLKAIGGFEGALGRHVERQIRALFREAPDDPVHPGRAGRSGRALDLLGRGLSPAARNDRERFQMLLTLLTLRQVDGTTSTALLREEELRAQWRGRMAFEELIPHADQLRLLRTTTRRLDSGREERLISLGHDALAKVAEPWKRELEQQAERRKWRNRGMVSAAAAVLFAGLTFEAIRDRKEAVAQRKQAEHAQDEAWANAARAKDAAEQASQNARRAEMEAEKSRRNLARFYMRDGTRYLEEGLSLAALLYFAEAFYLDQHDPARAEMHRRRVGTVLKYTRKSPLILFDEGRIQQAEFSPDGRSVAIARADGSARLLEAATGRPIAPPMKHGDGVRRVAFSPDGRRVATIGDDGTVLVWDAKNGSLAASPLEHGGIVRCVAFSPDGGKLISAGSDRRARVWDLATGKAAPSSVHGAGVLVAAFSPDGRSVATSTSDGDARVWDASSGRPISPVIPHKGVYRLAFSPESDRLVTGSQDLVRVWDASTAAPRSPYIRLSGGLASVSFTDEGRRVITVTWAQEARLWEAATGRPVLGPVHARWAHRPVDTPDRRYYLFISPMGQLARIEDHATGNPRGVNLPPGDPLGEAAFSPDGRRLATAGADHTARIWDVTTGQPIVEPIPHADPITHVSFSPDGGRLVTITRIEAHARADRESIPVFTQEAHVWDAATGRSISPPLRPRGGILSARFSPDGRRLLTAGSGREAQVWDIQPGATPSLTLLHDDDLLLAIFSPDGSRILTAGRESARFWEAATGRPSLPALRHPGAVRQAAFSPDGLRLVLAGDDQSARVWDAVTGEPVSPALRSTDTIAAVVFSPDGRHVATAGSDKGARVWDARSGEAITANIKHGAIVRSVSFNADGRMLLTTGDDGTARVWDAATGEPISPALKHSGLVRQAIFSPDGGGVLTASSSRRVDVWELPRDGRAVEELLVLARVISGARIDPASGLLPGDFGRLRHDWHRLRESCPESFEASDDQIAGWHRDEAHDAEEAEVWTVAAMHREALVAAEPGSGAQHARLGRALLESGQFTRALGEFDRAIALHSADPDLRYQRGRALGRLGRWREARDDFGKSLEARPDDGVAWCRRHLANARLGEWVQADADYAHAVENSPAVRPRTDCWWSDQTRRTISDQSHRWAEIAAELDATPKDREAAWWVWRSQGLAYAASGHWKEAVASFSKAIAARPDDRESRRGRGRANAELNEKNHWTQAVTDYSRAIALGLPGWDSWYVRGVMHARLGQYDEAVKDLSGAIERGASGWGVWAERGYASARTQDLRAAISDYSEVIRRNPDALSYNNRGVAFQTTGEFVKALRDFDEAIRLNARFALAVTNRGETYRKLGDNARAIDDSTAAIGIAASKTAYLHRADAYAAAGQFDKAIDDYTAALELGTSKPYAFRRRAAAHLARREYGRAIEDYSEVLGLVPTDVDALIARAGAYLHNQEFGKAAADCAEAMRRQPGRGDAWTRVFRSPADVARADRFLNETLSQQEKAAAGSSASTDDRRRPAATLIDLAHLYTGSGHIAQAEDAYRRALAIRQKLSDDFPRVPALQEELAQSLSSLGGFLKENNRAADAAGPAGQAAAIWRRLATDSPSESRLRESLAESLDDLGDVLRESGRLRDAEQSLVEADGIRRKLVADSPDEPRYQHAESQGLVRLAGLLKADGRLGDADGASAEAVAILVRLADHVPKMAIYQEELASSYKTRGDLWLARGRADESARAFRQALAVRERLVAQFSAEPRYQNDLAWLLATCPIPGLRDVPRAVDLSAKAVRRATTNGNDWITRGAALYRSGDWKGAIKALETSIKFRARGAWHAEFLLAMARWQLGAKEQARREYDRAVEGMAKARSVDDELRYLRDEAAKLLGVPQAGKPEPARAG
jgi:WD40 repeat protein/tetratricopeptide (TPR) repeat protein